MTQSHQHGIRGAIQHLPEIIESIEAQSGIALVTTNLLSGGEQGAMRVTDGTGNQFILKTHRHASMLEQYQFAATTVRLLRQRSYPAPDYIAVGATSEYAFALIEELLGEPNQPLTASLLRQLIALNTKHRGQAPTSNPGWVPEIVHSVVTGHDAYCIVGTLRDHSNQSASILRRIQEIAERCQHIETPENDIVHFDFHPANALSIDGRITGIIDWDGVQVGDASFDLATLLFYCYHIEHHRQTLTREIVNRSDSGALRLYLVHMILRQIDWSIRHHDDATADYFTSRAERILSDLSTYD